eukprot:359139-Chlamydomonas_euryale.AAC.11
MCDLSSGETISFITCYPFCLSRSAPPPLPPSPINYVSQMALVSRNVCPAFSPLSFPFPHSPKSTHCASSVCASSVLRRSGRPASYIPASMHAPMPVDTLHVASPSPAPSENAATPPNAAHTDAVAPRTHAGAT